MDSIQEKVTVTHLCLNRAPSEQLRAPIDHLFFRPLFDANMSMLQKLKEVKSDSVFLEDEDEDFDVDNMDFPLPDTSSSRGAATGLEDMMAKLSAGQTQRPAAANVGNIAVANTPQGIQRLDPSVYKK